MYIGTASFLINGLDYSYTGLVNSDGKAFGYGVAISKEGEKRTGTFKNNTLHGLGKSHAHIQYMLSFL